MPAPDRSPGGCEKETESERLYQPFASGARLAAAATPGAVESYWSENAPTRALPATSVQMPVTEAVAESGPEYEPPEQLLIPETASVAEKPTPTSRLYHPFESGPRAGVPTGTVGGVLSILIVTTGLVTVPQVKVAVHWRVFVPSALISSAAGQPLVSTRSVVSTIQRIVTLLVYQPFEPSVPVSVKLTGAAAAGTADGRWRLSNARTPIGMHNRRSDDPARTATRVPLPATP